MKLNDALLKMNKKVLLVLIVCLLISNIYCFGLLLNASVEINDTHSETARLTERSSLALQIIRKGWVGKNASYVIDLSKELEQQGMLVKSQKSLLEIGDIIFETKDDLVSEARYID